MALATVRDRQEGFAGGLNTTSDDAALAPNECRVAINAQLDRRGAVRKRLGTQAVSASPFAASVMGGFSWARTSSVQELVVANGKLYTGALGIPMTWTDRGGTLSTTVYPTFAAFKGPTTEGVYFADGGLLNFWDGTTLTENITNTPSVEAIAAWGPRLFAVKDDTLYWSSTTSGINGHTLGATAGGGQAIIRTYGGQALVALAPLKGSLLLFHRSAISRFSGSTTDDINIQAGTQGISGDIGTVAKRSIVPVENTVYFLSDRGVFAVSETDVQPVSSPLESTLVSLTKSAWEKVSAVHARAFNEVRWFIPDVGIYVFNYRTNGWSGPWTGSFLEQFLDITTETGDTVLLESGNSLSVGKVSGNTTALWGAVDSDGKPVVLSGHDDGSVLWNDRSGVYVDSLTVSSSGGVGYPFQVQCKRFFGKDYTTYKSWRTMYVLGDFPDPANVECVIDTEGSGVTIPLPYSTTTTSLVLEWGHPSTVWGAPGTTWGGAGVSGVERGQVPLHGTHPWVDVSFVYEGTKGCRVSIVDVMGYLRNRR